MQGVIDSDDSFFVQAAQAGVQELRSKATSLQQKAEEARAS
jgi:hypothetical protein